MHIARNMVRKAISDDMSEANVDRVMVSVFGNNDSIPIETLLNRMAVDRLALLTHEDQRHSRNVSDRRF